MTQMVETLVNSQYNKLRNTSGAPASWAGDQYITFDPCDVVFAARVNGAIAGSTPFAQITYDTVTTGAYTDIEVGQVVIVSPTSNNRNPSALRLRVRKAPTSSVLYINEISYAIADDSYIWVLNTYDPIDKLARPTSTTVQAKDYEQTYANLPPTVRGLQTGYAGFVDSSSSKYRLALSITADIGASGSTISSYAWTFKAATYTVISGSLTAAAVTVDLTAGWQWAKLVVTDSNGQTCTRHFAIAAHDYSSYPTNSIAFNGASINGTRDNGWSATFDAFDGVSDVLNGTFCIIWTDQYYNGTRGAAVGSGVDMIGWLEGENNSGSSDVEYSFSSQVQFRVSGVAARMQQVEAQMLAVRQESSPDEWDEIANLTPWRAVIHYLHRHTTILTLCDWYDDDRSTTWQFPYVAPQNTNIFESMQNIASAINARLEFSPTGAIMMRRDVRFASSATRAALTANADFTDADFIEIVDYSFEHWDKVGKVDYAGAFYNISSGNAQAYRSRAPGFAQGYGSGTTSLENQILAAGSDGLTASAELSQRAGNALSIENETVKMALKQPDGYYWLIPTFAETYTLTADTTYNRRNISLTTSVKWLCESVNFTHNNEKGSREVSSGFTSLTPIGDVGDNVPPINEGEIPSFELPPLEPFPEIIAPEIGWLLEEVPNPEAIKPPAGEIASKDGNTVLWWNTGGTGLWITRNYVKLRSPQWKNITPSLASGYTIQQAIFSPFYTSSVVPIYVLASNGTNSRVYYTENALSGDLVWSEGASFSGVYDTIRAASTEGSVLVESPSDDTTWTNTSDFTISSTEGGWYAPGDGLGGGGSYSAGVGWVSTIGSDNYNHVILRRDFPEDTTIDTVDVYISYDPGGPTGSGLSVIYQLLDGGNVAILTSPGGVDPVFSSSLAFTADGLKIDMKACNGGGSPCSLNCTVSKIIVTGTGPNPFGGSGSAAVRVSSDFGDTFGSGVSVGTSAGAVGVADLQYIGTVSYAAASGKVRKASTIGGAYSDHTTYTGQPVCVVIPWGTQNSSSINNLNIASPDYVVAETIGKLWWVTGAASKTDITPSGVTSFNSNNCISTWLGTYLRVIGVVSGTPHLFTSTNGGTSWTDRGAVSNAAFIRGRKKRKSSIDTLAIKQLFITGGSTLKYSGSNGATLVNRTEPSSSGAGLDVLG